MQQDLYKDVLQWAQAHREEYIADVTEVCKIRSVSYYNPENKEEPFGPGCKQMLDKALEMSKRYGFETRNYDNFCGSAVYGDNKDNDSIGIVAHMDIVPELFCGGYAEGEGWTKEPFDPVLSEDGKYLFGRGTADNKAPGIVGLYAMRYLKEKGIKLKNNVMLVYGMNEEIGMKDMPELLKREKASKLYLVPDSKYPVCTAESGSVRFGLKSQKLDGNIVSLLSGKTDMEWSGPTVSIPSKTAYAELSGISPFVAAESLQFYENTTLDVLENGNIKVIVEKDEKMTVTQKLYHVLSKCGLVTGRKTLEMLNWLCWFVSDPTGKHIGIDSNAGPNDPLSIRTNLAYIEDGCLVFYANTRYPSLADKEKIHDGLEKCFADSSFEVITRRYGNGFYIDPQDKNVCKLREVAKRVLGRDDIPDLLDGGTYAQILPNAIPFGATVPDRVRLFGMVKGGAHQADEYCDIPNLLTNIAIYVQALVELDEML